MNAKKAKAIKKEIYGDTNSKKKTYTPIWHKALIPIICTNCIKLCKIREEETFNAQVVADNLRQEYQKTKKEYKDEN